MAPPTPATSPLVERILKEAKQLSDVLAPKTPAYHTIWLEGQELDLNSAANSNFVRKPERPEAVQQIAGSIARTPFLTGAFINYLRQLPATLVAER